MRRGSSRRLSLLGCETVRAGFSSAELTRQPLDFRLSFSSFSGDTGRPIVELLLVLANLVIRRCNARARGGARAGKIGTSHRIGDWAERHTPSIIGGQSSAYRPDPSFRQRG